MGPQVIANTEMVREKGNNNTLFSMIGVGAEVCKEKQGCMHSGVKAQLPQRRQIDHNRNFQLCMRGCHDITRPGVALGVPALHADKARRCHSQ